jgi:hypothetical protein
MRKCCCCVSVHVGAAILGSIGLIICALELVFSIPFIFDFDIDVFNPIKANQDIFFQTIENEFEELKKQDVNKTVDWSIVDAAIEHTKTYLWSTFIGATVETGVYALSCILLIMGALCQVRGLMIPYLILQMLVMIVVILVGIALSVFLFFFHVITGAVAAGVVLIISFLLIYFWIAVQRAYVELGNNDYMYSPAPIKPAYNDHHGRGGYYPTSPQHFQMDERK